MLSGNILLGETYEEISQEGFVHWMSAGEIMMTNKDTTGVQWQISDFNGNFKKYCRSYINLYYINWKCVSADFII